jgi:hypothetical protein
MFRKPIELRFYTDNRAACDLFPPVNGAKKRPSWVREATSGEFDMGVQNCRGMRELFRNGIAVPLGSVLKITTTPDQMSWSFADKKSHLMVEGNFGVMHRKSEALCKLVFPWAVECSSAVNFVQVQNTWDRPAADFRTVNGALEFKYQHAINMFLYIPPGTNTVIPAGTAFFLMMPMTERPIRLSAEYNPEKYYALSEGGESRVFFKNWYVKQRHIRENKT